MRTPLRLTALVVCLASLLAVVTPASALTFTPASGPEPGMPTNLARLLAWVTPFADSADTARRRTVRMVRQAGVGEFVHVGPLHGRRFTVTAISDQVCVRVPRRPAMASVTNGPCTSADRLASPTPLQDSGHLLLLAARESFQGQGRVRALRELLDAPSLRYAATLVAPHQVRVTAVVDRDRNGYDDDGRVAFHAEGRTVCATLPLRARAHGTVTFGSCAKLSPRPVTLPPEDPRRVFRQIKSMADLAVSMGPAGHPMRLARQTARMLRELALRPGLYAEAVEDRVQIRVRVNGHPAFACYRVDPDGSPAVYATSGEPGTWQLGRCR